MIRSTLIGVAALGVFAGTAAPAGAAPLFVTAEQHNPGTVVRPHRFSAIIGFPKQCVQGIPCWQYSKGTRSGNGHFPESWYLHQDGRRIRDRVFHLWVMDPRSRGWQQHVAAVCARLCFLDGMGTSSIGRTTPRLRWSVAQWTSRAALVVRAVRRAGKQVLPNSVGYTAEQGGALIAAAGGRGSTESFNTRNAKQTLSRGAIWATEIGGCLAKYHAFQRYRGRGDRFACYEHGHLPWDLGWLR